MFQSKSLIDETVNALLTSSELSDIDVISEFPSKRRDMPLCKVTVSVGAERVAVKPFEKGSFVLPGASPMTICLKVLICAPRNTTGIVCYDVLDRVMSVLLSTLSYRGITEMETGEMKFSSSLNGLYLPLNITVSLGNVY